MQSQRSQCANDHRQIGLAISMYSSDNSGLVPFAFRRSYQGRHWITPADELIPSRFFDVAATYWPYPIFSHSSEYERSLSLICPSDWATELTTSEQDPRPPGDSRIYPSDLKRSISRSFYYHPHSLSSDKGINEAAIQFRVARISEVAFPSAKALVFENSPTHDDYLVGYAHDEIAGSDRPFLYMPGSLGHRMVASADNSISLRSIQDANPPVIPFTLPPYFTSNTQANNNESTLRNSVTFDYTRMGVLGRDWQ